MGKMGSDTFALLRKVSKLPPTGAPSEFVVQETHSSAEMMKMDT